MSQKIRIKLKSCLLYTSFITNNERYNQVIDIWTHVNSELSNILMKTISSDDQGFNLSLIHI